MWRDGHGLGDREIEWASRENALSTFFAIHENLYMTGSDLRASY